jgi:serine/threonine protein kinase
MYEVNKNCAIKFPEKEKEELHPDILEFIMRMLESNPSRRVTPKNALETSLLTKPEVSQSLIKYFQIQKERAMKKVLQFANNSNI